MYLGDRCYSYKDLFHKYNVKYSYVEETLFKRSCFCPSCQAVETNLIYLYRYVIQRDVQYGNRLINL